MEDHYGFNVPEHRIIEATVQAAASSWPTRGSAGRHRGRAHRRRPDPPPALCRRDRAPSAAACAGVRPAPGAGVAMLPAYVGDDVVDTHRRQEIVAPAPASPPIARVQDGGEAVPLAWRLQRGQHAGAGRIDRSTKTGCSATPCWTSTSNCASLRTSRPSPCSVALRFNLEARIGRSSTRSRRRCARCLTAPSPRCAAATAALELETMMRMGAAAALRPPACTSRHVLPGRWRARTMRRMAARRLGIWPIGQKAREQASLLLYLKRHYLNNQAMCPPLSFSTAGQPSRRQPLLRDRQRGLRATPDRSASPRWTRRCCPVRSPAAGQFIAYLRSIQSRLSAPNRLVLLLNEFSRTTDLHLQGQRPKFLRRLA